jgi:hypothetical protein
MRLYPRKEADTGTESIVLSFQNEEAEQIVGRPTDGKISFRVAKPRDKIFGGLFELSFNPPPPDQRPIPVADYVLRKTGAVLETQSETGTDREEEPSQAAPPCSPARFEPYS